MICNNTSWINWWPKWVACHILQPHYTVRLYTTGCGEILWFRRPLNMILIMVLTIAALYCLSPVKCIIKRSSGTLHPQSFCDIHCSDVRWPWRLKSPVTNVTVLIIVGLRKMEKFSALLAICAGNSTVPGEFPAQRPVTRSFDVFFDLRLNERLSKQPWDWWLETPSRPLWRHSNE